MILCETDPHLDFIFGLAGNKVLSPKAKPLLERARALHQTHCTNAQRLGNPAPQATRSYDDVAYQAGSWPKTYRVVVKAEVMALGDKPLALPGDTGRAHPTTTAGGPAQTGERSGLWSVLCRSLSLAKCILRCRRAFHHG